MLADSRHSRLVLINPSRGGLGDVSTELVARKRESLVLLSAALELFGIAALAIGEYDPAITPDKLVRLLTPLDGDGLSLWRDQRFTQSLGASDIGVILLGGAWLEEEVFIAALQGVRHGYDVRVLADLSVARIEADRGLVLDRLAMHGVPAMTVRQALLEWATCLEDPVLKQRVQQLLA
jgi:hypothetical protein